VEPIELMLDAVLGGGVQHLRTNAGSRRGPGIIVDWVNVSISETNRRARVGCTEHERIYFEKTSHGTYCNIQKSMSEFT
jgi:hypothetical protein